MFNPFDKTKYPDPAQNIYQPEKEWDRKQLNLMCKEIGDLQSIVDAMCKVYVAQHAKDIEEHSHHDKQYRDDQPIIDRAKVMELQRKIQTAQADLKILTNGRY
jgi:hypothetical protein